jgi:type 1 glutamine amidotransferase
VNGIKDFSVHSEQYFLHIDPSINVIASTKFNKKYHEWIDGVDMPIAYTKKWGDGNIFHCSIGHNLKDFENTNVVKLITQGINWASK